MKIKILLFGFPLAFACNGEKEDDATDTTEETVTEEPETTETAAEEVQINDAFSEFSENVTTYLDGEEVVIETNGLPNHTSPYWSTGHELYVAPTVTSEQAMAPGNIDDFNGSYTLRVPASPEKASASTATGMGAIGIAVSGSVIYNDQEGENVPLDNAAPSLDYTGAHTGPNSYHYHLETKAWSEDDEKLIGIMADGFFLYGRRCNSTGTYPEDLDESGGHTHTTQHGTSDSYHYHIQNDLYLEQYYILFPGDFQGTPSSVQ